MEIVGETSPPFCRRKTPPKNDMRQAMAAADADGNGLISKEEMPDLLKGRCLRSCLAVFFW